MFPVAAVRKCREELEKKYDLTLYTTDVAMDDIEDARVWLGYGKINLNGGSYGTRAAQTFLRRHPQSVRTAILNGVVPMDETLPISHAAGGQRSLDLLLGWCEKDPACHGAFPAVRKEFQAVLDRLAEGPVQVEIEHPVTHKKVAVKVSREVIADGIRWQLYTPESGAALPRLVHEAAGGSFSPLAQAAVNSRVGIIQILSMGMFFSVTCAEDIPFIDPDSIAARTAGSFLSDYRVRQQMGACAVWPKAKVPAGHQEAVHSDVPVLLINGERDPVTPPAFGERTARFLSNSRHVVVPFGAHGGSTDCVETLQRTFLEKGAVKGLDTSCLAKIPMTPFEIEAPKPAP
jgi:pimeloyl-ACP methyl ester carboxylesterase